MTTKQKQKQALYNRVVLWAKKGQSYTHIGKKFGLSTERVRQICVLAGMHRKKEHETLMKKLLERINKDIQNDISYDKLIEKYKINKTRMNTLRAAGMPALSKIYIQKRNEIVLREFKKGKTAIQIMYMKHKHLNGNFAIGCIDLVYKIATKNNLYKQPKVKDRYLGGTSENQEVLEMIHQKRDVEKLSCEKVAQYLNDMGARTITGKKFSPQLVSYKYYQEKK